jgi:HD-GYP domain-containing protein (c-di-GMP phosphodiesterase class II)
MGSNSYAALAERCHGLRLACWHLSAGGEHLIEPQDKGPTGRWLRAAVLREHIWEMGRGWLEIGKPEAVELAPGCWLLPSLQWKNRRISGLLIGMTFGPEVFDGKWFASICRKAGVDAGVAREALSGYTWPSTVDLELLEGVLDQTVHEHARINNDTHAIDQFSEQLLGSYEEINLLFRLARLMNSLSDPNDLIPMCCQQVLPVLPFNWIAVKFWERQRRVVGLTGRLIVAGELPCKTEAFARTVIDQFSGKTQGDWTRLVDPASGGVAELVGSEVVVEQIMHDSEVVGVLLAGNKRGDSPMESDVSSGEMMFLEATANLMGVFHENIARFDEQKQMFMGTLTALTAAIDAKDEYTRGHSERVAYMAAQLAQAMGMNSLEVERIHTTGLVHDVGKIGVPEAVLCKSGKLTDEEFDQIKLHPTIGYNILKGIMLIDPMLPGVLHHHERWDGRGYPHRLAAEEIPLDGRILALADTFDAMSSTRSYRPAMPRHAVLEEIRRCAGSQFDPALAPLFVELDFSGYDRMVERHGADSRHAA